MKWRRERPGKQIFLIPALLVCIFLLGSCNGNAKEPKGVEKSVSEKKKAELQKRISRKYQDAEAHYQLGKLYQADGLWAKAESEYGIALNFDPVHRKAQAARVKVLMVGGDTSKAKLLAEEYMKQATVSAAASLQLAMAYQNEQALDDYALKCYQQALYMAPNSAKINRQIGFYYLSKGQKDIAREYLSRSFQLNSNQPDVARELGRLGVSVRIPRKTPSSSEAKKLDDMVDKSSESKQPE